MANNDLNRWFSLMFRSRHSTGHSSVAEAPPGTPLRASSLISELSSQKPMAQRIVTLKQLSALLRSYTLPNITDLWSAVNEEFLGTGTSPEARHAAYEFMIACINNQYDE